MGMISILTASGIPKLPAFAAVRIGFYSTDSIASLTNDGK